MALENAYLSLFHDLASVPTETDLIVIDFSKAFDQVSHSPWDSYTSLSGMGSGVGLLTGSNASCQTEPRG